MPKCLEFGILRLTWNEPKNAREICVMSSGEKWQKTSHFQCVFELSDGRDLRQGKKSLKVQTFIACRQQRA